MFILIWPLFSTAQQVVTTTSVLPVKKRLIDSFEILASIGPSFIDDHGWSLFIKEGSLGQTTYELREQWSRSIALNLVHSFTLRFDLLVGSGVSISRYMETYTNYNVDGTLFSYSVGEQFNKYWDIQIIPVYFLESNRKFHAYLGPTYSRLIKSEQIVKRYENNQLTDVSRISTIGGFPEYEISAQVGLGYFIPLNKIWIGLRTGLRYRFTDMINVNSYRLTRNTLDFSLIVKYCNPK